MNRSFLLVAITLLTVPILGVAVGYVVLADLLIPTLGLGDVERIVQLGRHLRPRQVNKPYTVFLGDSVTMAGIDTTIVQANSGRAGTIENLALTGCGVDEQRVLLPKVMRARPDIVVLAFGPTSLNITGDLPLDKAYAYAMSEFPQAWPENYTQADFSDFSPATFNALRSARFEQILHFRTAPLNWFNARLRLKLRSDLRDDTTEDWTHPYQMLGTVSEKTLTWHLDVFLTNINRCRIEGERKAIPSIRRLVATVGNAGATPVLVVSPIHPRLRDDADSLLPPLNQLLAELARQHHGIVVDGSNLLTEKQFADAIHPNAEGRAAYSRFVGTYLSVFE